MHSNVTALWLNECSRNKLLEQHSEEESSSLQDKSPLEVLQCLFAGIQLKIWLGDFNKIRGNMEYCMKD